MADKKIKDEKTTNKKDDLEDDELTRFVCLSAETGHSIKRMYTYSLLFLDWLWKN